MIKHLITGGCSFSSGFHSNGWTGALTKKYINHNAELTYNHTGRNSSGNDLIQKRMTIAILDALEQGYHAEEILAVVMWSGTSRRAWYIDNEAIILKMVEAWAEFNGGMTNQFVNMRGDLCEDLPAVFRTANGSEFKYNPSGGWYLSVNGSDTTLACVKEHFLLDREVNGVGKTHDSLANIIELQNFCRLHNITLVNQFFMNHVYEDIERHRDHDIINYLYRQFNHNYTIKQGLFEYLHPYIGVEQRQAIFLSHDDRKSLSESRGVDYFHLDGFHPGEYGYNLWCDQILFPFLSTKNLL